MKRTGFWDQILCVRKKERVEAVGLMVVVPCWPVVMIKVLSGGRSNNIIIVVMVFSTETERSKGRRFNMVVTALGGRWGRHLHEKVWN